jgi:hypothetical protein
MDFRSVQGKHHLIEPIGYCQVRKTKKVGAKVRSTTEQFLIHEIAYEFESSILCIPKPIRLEETSYCMEQIWGGTGLPPRAIPFFPLLVYELRRFRDFLISKNIYPAGFTILQIDKECIEGWSRPCANPLYALVDMSCFGIIQGPWVSIPKLSIVRLEDMNTCFELFLKNPEDTSLNEQVLDNPDLPFAFLDK